MPLASYGLSKSAGTLFAQLLANQIPPEKLQIVSYHPGSVWNPGWPLPKDAGEFDDRTLRLQLSVPGLGLTTTASLAGAFAVWAASSEAAFLNGRTVWASWDVEELAKGEVRKMIEEDGDYLRISVVGYHEAKRARRY